MTNGTPNHSEQRNEPPPEIQIQLEIIVSMVELAIFTLKAGHGDKIHSVMSNFKADIAPALVEKGCPVEQVGEILDGCEQQAKCVLLQMEMQKRLMNLSPEKKLELLKSCVEAQDKEEEQQKGQGLPSLEELKHMNVNN